MSPSEHLAAALDHVSAIVDPLDQLIAANELSDQVRQLGADVRVVRINAVQTLVELGWGYDRIAEVAGLSKPRVQQLARELKPVKRPGVIETRARLAAMEARGTGASDAAVARQVIPVILDSRGGGNVTVEQMSDWLAVSIDVAASALDTEVRKRSAS